MQKKTPGSDTGVKGLISQGASYLRHRKQVRRGHDGTEIKNGRNNGHYNAFRMPYRVHLFHRG